MRPAADTEAEIVALMEREPDLPLGEVARRLRTDLETVVNATVKRMQETGGSQIPHILRSIERRSDPRRALVRIRL
jgi:hypothetical protein